MEKGKLIKSINKRLENAPAGSLKVIMKNNHYQYYRYLNGKKEYISKKM